MFQMLILVMPFRHHLVLLEEEEDLKSYLEPEVVHQGYLVKDFEVETVMDMILMVIIRVLEAEAVLVLLVATGIQPKVETEEQEKSISVSIIPLEEEEAKEGILAKEVESGDLELEEMEDSRVQVVMQFKIVDLEEGVLLVE